MTWYHDCVLCNVVHWKGHDRFVCSRLLWQCMIFHDDSRSVYEKISTKLFDYYPKTITTQCKGTLRLQKKSDPTIICFLKDITIPVVLQYSITKMATYSCRTSAPSGSSATPDVTGPTSNKCEFFPSGVPAEFHQRED